MARKKKNPNYTPRNNFQWHRYGCAPPPYRTLADMTEKEIIALEKQYNCPVIRPVAAHG